VESKPRLKPESSFRFSLEMASANPRREIPQTTYDYYLYDSDSESASSEPPFEELLEDVQSFEDLLEDNVVEEEVRIPPKNTVQLKPFI